VRPDDSVTLCSCGHAGSAHEHFRAGTDCGLCRPERPCTQFRKPPSSLASMVRRAAHIQLRPQQRVTASSSLPVLRETAAASDEAVRCAVLRFTQARAHLDLVIAKLLAAVVTEPLAIEEPPDSLAARIPAQRTDSDRSVSHSIAAAIAALDLGYEAWLDADDEKSTI